MRINLNFGYDKLHLKEIVILIPKYHTNMVSFLTPILGLYGINVKEFINEFEIKTKFIAFDVVIPTSVKISKIKTFEISLKTPYVIPILSNLEDFSVNKPNINILSIYKVSLIKSLSGNSFLFNYQKNIYTSIRKYISLIVKGASDIKIPRSIFNLSSTYGSKKLNFEFFKKTLVGFAQLKKLMSGNFGVFFIFNNSSAYTINSLKKILSIYKMSIDKVKSKFISAVCGKSYFRGNIFFISSENFKAYSIFHKELYSKTFSSNFFPIYWRFKSNLITRHFYKEIYTNFSATVQHAPFYILKIISTGLFKPLKVFSYRSKTLLFLLKYHYANLSSNTP